MNLQGCHRRGGYQPPARYKPTITNQLGRIRTMSDVVPFNRTLLTRNKSGRLRASPTMGTNCMPFNQARSSVTLRAAGSRPYDGWAIASAWYAETLPGTAQESRISYQPGAPLSAGTARQITIYVLRNPIPVFKNKPTERCRSAGQCLYFGNRTRMVVPSPRRLSTWILPLWSRTACLTMESPRPVPPTSLERLLSTR